MIVSISALARCNSSRNACRLRSSSSRSAINVAGTAISRVQAAQTSAFSLVSHWQYGQFISGSRRNLQNKAGAAGTAVAVLDVHAHHVFSRRQFGVRHVDAVSLDEWPDAIRQVDIWRAQINHPHGIDIDLGATETLELQLQAQRRVGDLDRRHDLDPRPAEDAPRAGGDRLW